ncbi:MAG: hypothetical protein JXA61_03520 [Bacteroidales bacterium]|nr:hypothetical protein [Bacteroidales bacterium]
MEVKEIPKNRPDTLTVVCILSFVGLGWRIFRSLMDAVAGTFTSNLTFILDDVVQDLESEDEPFTSFAAGIMTAVQKLMENISVIALIKILCSILALVGVILIWNLRKPGFYIYAVFRILILLIPVMVMGMNIISLSMVASGTVFTALFIVLYAIHLKYLK